MYVLLRFFLIFVLFVLATTSVLNSNAMMKVESNVFGTTYTKVRTLATSQESYCFDQNIKRIIRPVKESSPYSDLFSLAYKVFPSEKQNAMTVIVIPGGPGQTLLEKSPTENYPLGVIPSSQFNIVYTEPRGAGCNQLADQDFPVDGLSTNEVALDIVAIIKDLGLTHYIIYGASFGTVSATIVANLISKQNLPGPRAIVLEGTLGKGFKGGFSEYFSNYQSEWNRVKTFLPSIVVQQLSNSPLLFDFNERVWGLHIFQRLIPGDIPHYGHFLQYDLLPVFRGDTAGIQRLKSQLNFINENLLYYSMKTNIFKSLGCQELFGSWGKFIFLDKGELQFTGDICEGFTYIKPYDSKDWQVPFPLVYFQGPFDPATPLSSAQYHFANQRSSKKKIFITVDKAAHTPLSGSLYFLKCSDAVWSSIARDFSTLEKSLKTCGDWNITINQN